MARKTSAIGAAVAREGESYALGSEPPKFVGSFTLTQVVKHYVPIHAQGEGGYSLGALLDMQLEEAAMNGTEIQSVTLEVDPEYFQEFAKEVNRDKSRPQY